MIEAPGWGIVQSQFWGWMREAVHSWLDSPESRELRTPEEVARDYNLPVEAVLDAIDYCLNHRELLEEERAREAVRIKAAGRDRWPYAPRGFEPEG